jgi:hypothetical protein
MILAFLKNILSNSLVRTVLLIAMIFLLFSLYVKQCEDNTTLKKIYQQNQKALLDSLFIIKNKVGELSYEKYTLITDVENLKNINKDLYNETQKISGKVKEISEYNIKYEIDEIKKLVSEIKIKQYDKGTINTDVWKNNINDGSFNANIEGYTDAYLDTINCKISKMETYMSSFKYSLDLISYTKIDKDGLIVSGVKTLKETKGLSLNLKSYEVDDKIKDAWDKYNKKSSLFSVVLGPYVGYGLSQDKFNNYWFSNFQIGIGLQIGIKIFNF